MADFDAPVEQATAAPGEKRTVRFTRTVAAGPWGRVVVDEHGNTWVRVGSDQ